MIVHALDRVGDWIAQWWEAGRILLLLDFDGTLAPIVDSPDLARMPHGTREALERLRALASLELAVISGRALSDARERTGIEGILYAGNHGLEIAFPGELQIHAAAAAARPRLEAVRETLVSALAGLAGTFVEDKGLTLSVHYRRAARADVPTIRQAVMEAVAPASRLRVGEGKEVLEIRPQVDWDKGRAVDFILDRVAVRPGTPVLYIGDDRTDEDAFRALARRGSGDGVIVANPPPPNTAATCFLRDPSEVAVLLQALAESAEDPAWPRGDPR